MSGENQTTVRDLWLWANRAFSTFSLAALCTIAQAAPDDAFAAWGFGVKWPRDWLWLTKWGAWFLMCFAMLMLFFAAVVLIGSALGWDREEAMRGR